MRMIRVEVAQPARSTAAPARMAISNGRMPQAERKGRATPAARDFALDVMEGLPRWGKRVQRLRDDLQAAAAARRDARVAGAILPGVVARTTREGAPP